MVLKLVWTPMARELFVSVFMLFADYDPLNRDEDPGSFLPEISPHSWDNLHADTNAEVQTELIDIEQMAPDAVSENTNIDDNGMVNSAVLVVPNRAIETNQIDDNGRVNSAGESLPQVPKQRKNQSPVSKIFDKFEEEDGTQWARCKLYNNTVQANSKNGTPNLSSPSKRNGDTEKSPEMSGSSVRVPKKQKTVFDQERSFKNIARVNIEHGSMRMHDNSLQPTLGLKSPGSLKENLPQSFNKQSGLLNLTITMWERDAAVKYCCLTVHFTDDDAWELKKKVRTECCKINWDLRSTFRSMLLDWGIGNNVLSITAQNTEESDNVVTDMINCLGCPSSRSCYGKVLHINCFIHVLNLLVEDGLQEVRDVLNKIKKCVEYVHESPEKNQKFREVLNWMNSEGKKVPSEDMPVSWDLRFHMLKRMVELREPFFLLGYNDLDFLLNPEMEEWDKLTLICECLKVLEETVQSFPVNRCLAPDEYFSKACSVYRNLCQWRESVNSDVLSMACKMKEKFDKYWRKYDWVLAIVAVLDPRFKFDIVEGCFKQIYVYEAKAHCRRIRAILTKVYDIYASGSKDSASSSTLIHYVLDYLGMPCTSSHDTDDSQAQKSELERYLEEPKLCSIKEFDILAWWRVSRSNFPTLTKMARDFLAIPLSAPQSNPSFIAKVMQIDQTSTHLDPEIIDALICLKDC